MRPISYLATNILLLKKKKKKKSDSINIVPLCRSRCGVDRGTGLNWYFCFSVSV